MRKIIIPGALRWVAAGFKISIGLALGKAGKTHPYCESGS
jgi:ABC-type nitrate/sulfonate/bicarbonate transport system permease component